MTTSRRHLLQSALAASLAPWASLSVAATASAPGANRFVLFILRGGMDGLTAQERAVLHRVSERYRNRSQN